MFFVYVLRSRIKNCNYIGQTEDLKAKIKQHNSGKTKSVKFYLPVDLVYFEVLETRQQSIARERYLKSGIGREFLKNIIDVENACVVKLDRIPDFGSGG